MNVISFHGAHNAAIAFNHSKGITVVEVERFNGYKNSGISQYKTVPYADIQLKEICNWIRRHHNIDIFDLCVTSHTHAPTIVNGETQYIKHEYIIPHKQLLPDLGHHYLHAAGTYYQSNYEKMLIISFDGGGNDGFFNGFVCDNKKEGPKFLFQEPYDLGSYMNLGHYLKPIRQEKNLIDGNLVYSGKLMGLCGYGKVREEWLYAFKEFYLTQINYNLTWDQMFIEKMTTLQTKLGLKFDPNNRFDGEIANDLAATSQKAFETVVINLIDPWVKKYPGYAIGITGGCALNVLLNTEIKKKYNVPVFIPPNPSDCGIAIGGLLHVLKPQTPVELIYAGVPLLDLDSIGYYIQEHSYTCKIETTPSLIDLAKYICSGKILGVARGNSEHGPRALGNRSILCDPVFPEMKDILNEKVKNREWYRPFAPVVRYEDANKYFEILEESPYMSFAFKVRDEFKNKLHSVTHIDGTARVQTLRRETNPWLYDLLGEIERINGIGVLLNTSFNVNGKPILSTLADAFKVFDNTQMDGLLVENVFIKKQ